MVGMTFAECAISLRDARGAASCDVTLSAFLMIRWPLLSCWGEPPEMCDPVSLTIS